MTEILPPLPPEEVSQLRDLEDSITVNLQTVSTHLSACAEALKTIKEKHLYRATHSTFEAYCRERWKKAANNVRLAIKAFDVRKSILDDATRRCTGQPVDKKEFISCLPDKVILEAAKIKQEKRLDVLLEAKRIQEEKRLTANSVKRAYRMMNKKLGRPDPVLQRMSAWEACYGPSKTPVVPSQTPDSGSGVSGDAEDSVEKDITVGALRLKLESLGVPPGAFVKAQRADQWVRVTGVRYVPETNEVLIW